MVEIIEEQDLGKTTDSLVDKSSAFIREDEYKEIRSIISKSYTKTTRTHCIYPGCSNKADSNNHIIAENLIRLYEPRVDKLLRIEKDKYEVIFPPLDGRKLFQPLSIAKEPAFRGFCNSCDNDCFTDVDGYRHRDGLDVPDKVLIQMHYRIICNGLICLEKEQILVKALLEYFEQKKWAPQVELYKGLVLQIETSIGFHIKEKERCELYITKDRDTPHMARLFIPGKILNPLCFGRLGYYAYQFSQTKESVFTDFFGNMPFVTYSSIIGIEGESHIVFTALPEHTNQLDVINKMLEQPDPLDKLSRIIYIFSDGCILKEEHLAMHKAVISEEINYFIENSGLCHFE